MEASPEPRWLTGALIETLHDLSIQRFGGLAGVRDRGLLESALARPQHRFAYEGTSDLPTLAAVYAAGLARNHPFLDGNKRTALLAVRAFLFANGCAFAAPEGETVAAMLALAAGEWDEGRLAAWIARHAVTR